MGTSFRLEPGRQQKQLKVSERSMDFGCQPSTSAAVKRAEVVEEESVARKRHMAKQRKRALERLAQAKIVKKKYFFFTPH